MEKEKIEKMAKIIEEIEKEEKKEKDFDVKKYLVDVENINEVTGEVETSKFLPVNARKLWFRAVHPDGRIITKIHTLNDNVCITEAQIFVPNCPEAIANGYGQRYFENSKYGTRYVEIACTAAEGRALANAGFGYCSCDSGDEEICDSPLKQAKAEKVEKAEKPAKAEKPKKPKKAEKAEKPEKPEPAETASKKPTEGQEETQSLLLRLGEEATDSNNTNAPVATDEETNPAPAADKDSDGTQDSTEETAEEETADAGAMLLPTGIYAGKSIAEVYKTHPSAIEFWAEKKAQGRQAKLIAACKEFLFGQGGDD